MGPVRGRAALISGVSACLAQIGMPHNVETPRRNLTGAVVPAVAAAALAAFVAMLLVGQNRDRSPETAVSQNCILENADAANGPIDLIDTNGARVTQADFAGQPAVIYFGFTHCPDVCPTALYELSEALNGPEAYDVQTIMISVDPARDTPEVMDAYTRTEGFPAGLTGLTGSAEQVEAAERSFQVYASRAPIEGAPADVYNMDHSSFLYVLDGQWRTQAIYNTIGGSPEAMGQCIAAGLARAN